MNKMTAAVALMAVFSLAICFIIIGAIVSYADIVLGTLRGFGILGEDLLLLTVLSVAVVRNDDGEPGHARGLSRPSGSARPRR